MRYPSIQLLRGEWDTTADRAGEARIMGIGRPEKDPNEMFQNSPATVLRGDCGILLDPGVFPMGPKPWTLQIYGKIVGWTPVITSSRYPLDKDEFQIYIAPSYIRIYRFVSAGLSTLFWETVIPAELRGGYRNYRVLCNGVRTEFYVDETIVGAVNWLPNAPSNQVMLMAGQGGYPDAIKYGATCYAELVRFDVGYAVPSTELFKFDNGLNLTEAESLFDPTAVDKEVFQQDMIANVVNYAPPISSDDIPTVPGLIPVFGSSSPVGGFTVSASSEWNDDFQAWQAFRETPNNLCWVSAPVAASDAVPHELTIKSVSDMVFNSFELHNRPGSNGANRAIRFALLGRNADSEEWTLIKEYAEGDYPDLEVRFLSDFPVQAWRQVKLSIRENNVGTSKYVSVGKLQLHMYSGKPDKKIVQYKSGKSEVIDVPTSSEEGAYIANAVRKPVVGLQFDSYVIRNRTWHASIQSARSWELQGRNDPAGEWVVIDSQSSQDGNTSGLLRTYVLGEVATYNEVRIYITETNGDNVFTSVGELELLLDGVNQLEAMSSNVTGLQTADASSYYTSNGEYPAWMAFNQIEDGGWVSAAKATPDAPQWLSITTTAEYQTLELTMSDNRKVDAGEVVDVFTEWSYPEGSGYLFEGAFVPVTVEGGILTEGEDGYHVTLSDGPSHSPLSGNSHARGGVTVDPNTRYGSGVSSAAWRNINFHMKLDGVSLPGIDTFTLPKGSYYGTLRAIAIGGKGCDIRLATVGGTTIKNLPTVASYTAGCVSGQVYFTLEEDTEIALQQFLIMSSTNRTSKNVNPANPCHVMELNLFKVR